MTEISERREVRVRQDDVEFVFVADPDAGRLVLREERDGADEEVCAVTLADRDELAGFLEGLRRALGVDTADRRGQARPEAPAPPPVEGPASAPADGPGGDDRDDVVERARSRNPKAFAAWTPEEEERLVRAHRDGVPIPELARRHQRSQRAIEMRLDKLGADPGDGTGNR